MALEEVSGTSHGKRTCMLKSLILFYWRLEIFGGVLEGTLSDFYFKFGFRYKKRDRKEPLKCPTDGGSGPLSRMRVIAMQQDSIAEAG